MKHHTHHKKFSSIIILMTLFILFCSQFLLFNVKAQSSSGPYLILFDEFHDQYYSYSNESFKTALDYLNQTADFEVHLNKEAFENATELLSYDLIIIGNPGPDGNFSFNEIDVIKNYTELGGNLFLLCNYNDVGVGSPWDNLTGKASYLNNITQALNLPVLFTSYDLWDTTHNPLGDRWIVEIEDSNFQFFHPIGRKINSILTFTSGLNVTSNQDIIATGYSDSYLKNTTGPLVYETSWLFATQQSASRIIICGSTVMFSDVNVTDEIGESYYGVHWINALDNKRLWANLIQWVLITEIPNLFPIFLIVISITIAIGASLYIYNTYFMSPKSPLYEIEKQNLQDERAMVLKEARSRATEGMFLAASKLYKQAAKLSTKLGDSKAEELYNKNYREFLQKERAAVLQDAGNHAAEGRFQAAAQSYKQAAILSNKLGDRQEESQHNKKARQIIAKSKK